MNIFTYFKKKGINTIDSSFYTQIKLWTSWYEANVTKFHHYYVYNGQNKIRCRRLSLGMAKKVSEDVADLLLNERVKINIGKSEETAAFVEAVLDKNEFLVKGNDYQERKAYTGTVAYVLHMKDIEVDEDGNVMSGTEDNIQINYVQANNIFPISWENGRIKEVAFVFPKTINRKKYAVIQLHRLRNIGGTRQYVIENNVVECSSGAGKDVPYTEWASMEGLSGLAPEIKTGSDQPQFVIDKLNIVNNADKDDTNPMGIAIFANAIDVLAKIDLEYDSYANEFDLGRKRIFVAPEMLSNVNGDPVFDENDTVFYQLPEDSLKDGKPIVEVNMTIRAEEHSKALNDDLNFLSFKCGFGTERYKFERGTVTTATQVISENSDMYRTIKKHELVLQTAIEDLVYGIIRLGQQLRVPGITDDVEVTIDFDDSIIEDKETERKRDREDVAMGVMSLAEYRAKWYGEDEEEAKKKLPEQNNPVLDTIPIKKTEGASGGVIPEVQSKTLNGAQTQSLLAIMAQFTSGDLTEGQAVKLISTSIGLTADEARKVLNGEI